MNEKRRFFGPARIMLAKSILVISLITLAFPQMLLAEGCCECHDDVCSEGNDKLYVHEPFRENDCAVCHLAEDMEDDEYSLDHGAGEDGPIKVPKDIEWIGQNFTASNSQLFVFPHEKIRDCILVEVWDGAERIALDEIPLPAFDDLPSRPDPEVPPKISDVKVIEVRRGRFASAKISWKTNEFSDSLVAYGIKKLKLKSRPDQTLTKQHEMTLGRLEPKETYKFKVISADMYGNKAESDIFTFKTKKSFMLPEARSGYADVDKDKEDKEKKITVKREFCKHKDDFMAIFSADRPITVSVGVHSKKGDADSAYRDDDSLPEDHPRLKSSKDANIDNCFVCHEEIKEALSHPVNVFPKPEMMIPPEYPLLPDGRISCMSCHGRHGSNIEFRLLKQSKRALCVGCHGEY